MEREKRPGIETGKEGNEEERKKWSERTNELFEKRRKGTEDKEIEDTKRLIKIFEPGLPESEAEKKVKEFIQAKKETEAVSMLKWWRNREEALKQGLEKNLKPSTPSEKEQLKERVKEEIEKEKKSIINRKTEDRVEEAILCGAWSDQGNRDKLVKYGKIGERARNEVEAELEEMERLANEIEARESL